MKDKTAEPGHIRHYCCLYHFANGKKEKSSTPCYNHVPLGVINPLPTTVPRSPRSPPSDLKINSKQHQINFHTHDLNEIENKQSLPKRLAYPRVYVEQINPKFNSEKCNIIAVHEAFLKKVYSVTIQKEFQEIFLMFKRYAKLTKLKSQEEAIKHIQAFSKNRKISSTFDDLETDSALPQYFFSYNDFINYLIYCGFEDKQSEEFWETAFNRCRFSLTSENLPPKNRKQVVSMRAFAYNFKKFYLDELQTYKNCLSEPALRQRMIDLRLFLEPWFNRNIIFKQNHQYWKEIQLQICAELKRNGQDILYTNVIGDIELRNKIWLFMRTLSKIFYPVTDQKNIGLQVFNQRTTDLIIKNKDNLQAFSIFLNSFETSLIENNRKKQQKFKITDLLQFAKRNHSQKISKIVVYLRGLFKYLYFFKGCTLLSVNRQTLNLDCTGIAEVTFNEILQFLSFKQKETNHLMEIIKTMCNDVNNITDARPQVNGHKKFLHQCNYVAQALLKMIKQCDFAVFWRLDEVRRVYLEGDIDNLKRLKQVYNSDKNKQEISPVFWKQLFEFADPPKEQTSVTTVKDEEFDKNYKIALDQYDQLRKKLEGKLPDYEQKGKDQNTQTKQSKQDHKSKKDRSKQSKQQQNEERLGKQAISFNQSIDSSKHQCFDSTYCPLCEDFCSTSVASSLKNIDNMSNYLMGLLKDI